MNALNLDSPSLMNTGATALDQPACASETIVNSSFYRDGEIAAVLAATRTATARSAPRPAAWSGPIALSLFAHLLLAAIAVAVVVTGHIPRLQVEEGRASIALEASLDTVDWDQSLPLEETLPLFLTKSSAEPLASQAAQEPMAPEQRDELPALLAKSLVDWKAQETAAAIETRPRAIQLASVAQRPSSATVRVSNALYTGRRAAVKQTQQATLPAASSQASIASAATLGAKTVEVPEIVSSVAPRYPQRALSAGLSGTVLIRVTLDADGLVVAALLQRSSNVASLDAAAMEAIWLWRFSPASSDSQFATPFAAQAARQVIVPIDFVLRD